jgi:hypothetical protein
LLFSLQSTDIGICDTATFSELIPYLLFCFRLSKLVFIVLRAKAKKQNIFLLYRLQLVDIVCDEKLANVMFYQVKCTSRMSNSGPANNIM